MNTFFYVFRYIDYIFGFQTSKLLCFELDPHSE